MKKHRDMYIFFAKYMSGLFNKLMIFFAIEMHDSKNLD